MWLTDHSLWCTESRLSASLRSPTDLAAGQVSQSSDHLALHSCFSATTECERQISTLPWFSFPLTQNRGQWRGLPNACCAQLIRLTLPHHIRPKWGVWTVLLLPTTSYPVVERVALFWLYLSGKWIRGPALSPLLSGLMSLPCSAWEEPPPDLLSTLQWEVWPLLKHAEHGSCEEPPTSAFWLCWLGIFNLIYLFPLFKTKQFLAHWKKKKSQMFRAFLRQRCTPGCILGLNMEIPESELLCLEYL